MTREMVLQEFGIPISEWGNCEAMAEEIVRLRVELNEANADITRLMQERKELREQLADTEIGRSIETFTAAEHVAALVAMGWTEYASEFGSYHSVIAPEKRDEQ